MKPRRLSIGVLIAALILSPPEASAQIKQLFKNAVRGGAKGAMRSGGVQGTPDLSRTQLRQCLSEEQRLSAASTELDQLEGSLQRQGAAIDRLGGQIDAQESRVDTRSQPSVDAFNALIDRHSAEVDRYNSNLATIEARFSAYNARIDAFNARCADKSYLESDMQAIRAGR